MPGVVQAPEKIVTADDVGDAQRLHPLQGGRGVEDGLHQDGCATRETGHGSAESEDTGHRKDAEDHVALADPHDHGVGMRMPDHGRIPVCGELRCPGRAGGRERDRELAGVCGTVARRGPRRRRRGRRCGNAGGVAASGDPGPGAEVEVGRRCPWSQRPGNDRDRRDGVGRRARLAQGTEDVESVELRGDGDHRRSRRGEDVHDLADVVPGVDTDDMRAES